MHGIRAIKKQNSRKNIPTEIVTPCVYKDCKHFFTQPYSFQPSDRWARCLHCNAHRQEALREDI